MELPCLHAAKRLCYEVCSSRGEVRFIREPAQRNCFTATHGQAAPWTTSRYFLVPSSYYMRRSFAPSYVVLHAGETESVAHALCYFLLPSYEVCLCEAVSFRATGQRHGRDRVPVVEDDDLPLRGCAACDPPSGSAVCSSRGTRPTQLLHRNARTSRIMTTSRYLLLLTSYLLPLTFYFLPMIDNFEENRPIDCVKRA